MYEVVCCVCGQDKGDGSNSRLHEGLCVRITYVEEKKAVRILRVEHVLLSSDR